MFIIVDEIYHTEKLFHKLILPKQLTEIVFCNNSKCKKAPHFSVVLNCINNVKSPFFASSSCCVGIACAQSLYLRIIESSFINIGAYSFGSFGGHNLRNKFLLVLQNLIEVRIEALVGNVTEYINFGIFIALTLNSTIALFHIGRTLHTEHNLPDNREPYILPTNL